MMVLWKYTIAGLLLVGLNYRPSFAQYTLHIIASVPPTTNEIFIAGNFNDWNTGDDNYKLRDINAQQKEIVLHNLKAGDYHFKLSLGSEKSFEYRLIGINSSHTLKLTHDTTINIMVEAWANSYFNMANLSDSLQYEALEARAGYYVEINLDSSYKYAIQLYSQAKKLNSKLKEARALDLQGIVITRQGNGEKALSLFLKSLEFKKSINDSSGIAFTYGAIGDMYLSMQDFIKAKNSYMRCIQWGTPAYSFAVSIPLTRIGTLFFMAGKPDSALQYVTKALERNSRYVGALLLMGDIQRKINNDVTAIGYYKKAVAAAAFTFPGSPFFISNTEAFEKLGETFYKTGRTDSGFYYARKAFELAVKIKNPYTIINTGTALMDFFKVEKKYDSAFFYQALIMQNKDSLFTEAKERQVHNIFFIEKLRQQELDTQAEKIRSEQKFYVLAGIAALLLLAGIGYRARMKSKFTKQIAQIEMRALRAQMNPHFIFNCLASINRYIVKSDTKTASGYLTKFSKLIRLILDNSANEYISVDIEIQTLKLYLDMELLRFDEAFDYEIELAHVSRTDNTAIPTMIIQPYIENAIWHGLLHKEEKGKLWVRFIQLNDDILQVEIEDNGIGRKRAAEVRSKDTLKTKSYGMQISEERIGIINMQHHTLSSVTIADLFTSEGVSTGTKIILQLPLIELAACQTKKQTML